MYTLVLMTVFVNSKYNLNGCVSQNFGTQKMLGYIALSVLSKK